MEKINSLLSLVAHSLLFGDEHSKDLAKAVLQKIDLERVSFDELSFQEVLVILEEVNPSLNLWQGVLDPLLRRLCMGASDQELLNAIADLDAHHSPKHLFSLLNECYEARVGSFGYYFG